VYAQLPFKPFAAYTTGNPVVPSTPGTWDEYAVWWPNVIFVNDTFYMTYVGTNDFSNTPVAIGLAISSDGFNYTKSNSNPILSADGSGFDAYNIGDGVLFFSNPTWYLYYTGRSSAPNMLGDIIGRATSNISPHGPWTRSDTTLLAVGSIGEWDSGFIGVETIVENGSELIIYYFAGASWLNNPQIGMATSSDGGLTWEKYNDPATTTPPYVESDPVLKGDKPYDMQGIYGCTVLKRDFLWEMFYAGRNETTTSICYATSWDGVNWIKDRDSLNNPIFTPSQDPIATNRIEKPSVVIVDSLYFMYYDYNVTPDGIGLATAKNLIVPGIDINPVELNFGGVGINSDSTMTFTITNTGSTDLEISSITSNEPAFTVNFTSPIVPPGDNQDVEVTFTPTDTGSYSGTIEITHNAVGSPDSISVMGNGIPTGIEDELFNSIPSEFVIYQNYPNPFNPMTSIIFGLPEASEVKLTLFNSLGEEVTNLFQGYKNAGYHRVEFNVTNLSSGIYFYRLQAGDFVETKKMVLMK